MIIKSWRIVQPVHVSSAFTGEGAQQYPGRWNHRGIPAVYTAGSPSLAAMEMLVHLNYTDILQMYLLIPVTFDMRLCQMLDRKHLPHEWTSIEHLNHTRDIGTEWLKKNETLVFGVPSAVIPFETNYLINPRHHDFEKLIIGDAQLFKYDPRVMKSHDINSGWGEY